MIEKKQFFLIPLLPLGIILVGLGIYSIVDNFYFYYKTGFFVFNWGGIIPIILGISLFLFKNGFQFQQNEKTLIKFIEFAGINLFSKQKKLPKMIDNVQIAKRTLTFATIWAGLTPLKSKSIIFDVYIVHGHYFERLFSVDQKQAFEYGQIIADTYKVELINKA